MDGCCQNQRLDWIQQRLRSPQQVLQSRSEKLINHQERMAQQLRFLVEANRLSLNSLSERLQRHHSDGQLQTARSWLESLSNRVDKAMHGHLRQAQQCLQHLQQELNLVSPGRVLLRGYSILTRQETGQLVRSHKTLRDGEALQARVADGSFNAVVSMPNTDKSEP